MVLINIEYLDVNFPNYSYTLKEIVDVFFQQKLDDPIKKFAKNGTGIDRVYKSYDLSKITEDQSEYLPPHIRLNDMYVKIAEKALEASNRKPGDIGLLVMLNGNQQYLMPAPTAEMVSRLGLSNEVRTQNFQGLACSSFSEALRSAAGHFALGYKGDALILGSQYSSEWYLNIIRQIDKISINNKKHFYSFVYFLIFSDVVGAAIISKDGNNDKSLVQIDTDTFSSRKNTDKDNYKKAKVELSQNKKHQMKFNFEVNPRLLKKTVAELALENIFQLEKKFPSDFKNVKFWGLHTAGLSFVDYVVEKCGIDRKKAQLTYDVMRETGNTGSMSSLQLIKESVDRKILKKGEIGGIIDYGWEGSDSFLYHVK